MRLPLPWSTYDLGLRRTPAALLLLSLVAVAACGPRNDRPNILLIVLDDFGYNDLAINNGSPSPTPNLDEIARRGIRFTRHYTESSCTPSRIALLTGLYPARVGAHPYTRGIDREFHTLPEALGENGYTTHMVGKWHAGDGHREARPEYNGFDHWFGFMNQLYLRGPHEAGRYRRAKPTYRDPWLENERGELRQFRGHLTDILTDRAIEIMDGTESGWFLYLSYYAPHTPIEPAVEYAERFPRDPGGAYQALKAQLDHNIGRIVQHLEHSGQLDNTLLVVVSDNGGAGRSWPSNAPYHGAKATYGEGGVRTPLLLWWPGQWDSGDVNERIAMITDLYPTLLAAIGIDSPAPLDGIDLFGPDSERQLKWYSHLLGGDAYSVLSADGSWRFTHWLGMADYLHHEADFVDATPPNRAQEQAEITAALGATMQPWVRSATRIRGLQSRASGPFTAFSGYGLRRTPAGGSHTMGFTFQRGSAAPGSEPQTLVLQDGYVAITDRAETLEILVDGNELALPMPRMPCFSLVVSSQMAKANMIHLKKDSTSTTRVYINGELQVESDYINHNLSEASPRNPLEVRTDSAGRWYKPGRAEVFLSTRAVPADEIRDIVDPELRAACEPPPTLAGR